MLLALLFQGSVLNAQIDPTKRSLINFGYNQPLVGSSPLAGYVFYYLNKPNLYKNMTARFAIAPGYVDSEFGFKDALGKNIDLGISLAGGAFADSYTEIRQGDLVREESFTGHGGEIGVNIYGLLNPDQKIPLHAILKNTVHYATYLRDSATPGSFALPPNHAEVETRAGLRFAGREPKLFPSVGMEISIWYQGDFRMDDGPYGYSGDRRLERQSHMFWNYSSLTYTFPKSQQGFNVSMALGTGLNMDRTNVYRLGGQLPFISEFPFDIPGYYFQEISADRFALFGAQYMIPLGLSKKWAVNMFGNHAQVHYLSGLEQPGDHHSGAGSGITYISSRKAWKVNLAYSYGFDAIRNKGRGAHAIGLLLQYDFTRSDSIERVVEPEMNPRKSRGFDRIISPRSINR